MEYHATINKNMLYLFWHGKMYVKVYYIHIKQIYIFMYMCSYMHRKTNVYMRAFKSCYH